MEPETKKPGPPPPKIELEKKYGEVACKDLLNAVQLARKPADERVSKGFNSQTGKTQQTKPS